LYRRKGKNPYEVLELDTKTEIPDVIEKALQLTEESQTPEERMKYRKALEGIQTNPVERSINQFWEPPDTRYYDKSINDFCNKHRSVPVSKKMVDEKAGKFVEDICSPENLVQLAIPSTPDVSLPDSFTLEEIPESPLELPLELWEIFV